MPGLWDNTLAVFVSDSQSAQPWPRRICSGSKNHTEPGEDSPDSGGVFRPSLGRESFRELRQVAASVFGDYDEVFDADAADLRIVDAWL
jgi:hypothetical protein